MAQSKFAKRANKANPREDRNNTDYQKSNRRGNRQQQQNSNVVEFDDVRSRKKRVDIVPRNVAQERYVDLLNDDDKHIIFAMGPAGCGKTLLATLYAIKCYQEGLIEKIIITRPAVSVDEQHGFLPGSLIEKMAPWVLPIIDVFKEHYTPAQVDKMLREEIIDICPLAYMRGRTFKNAIILADEMQNSTPNQMQMVLTRIGEGSRMIVTGDLAQHDRGFEKNGLKDFTDKLLRTGSKSLAVATFAAKDVERHEVIEEILNIYKKFEE